MSDRNYGGYGGGNHSEPTNQSQSKSNSGGEKKSKYPPKDGYNDSKPSEGKAYTIFLDKDCPQEVLDQLIESKVLRELDTAWYTLRLPPAELNGLDTSVLANEVRGCDIYAPWKNFNNVERPVATTSLAARDLYAKNVVAELPDVVLTIAGIKVDALLGPDLQDPVSFAIVWTPDGATTLEDLGRDTGFLKVPLKIALHRGIKLINLNGSSPEEIRNCIRS